MDDLKLYAKSEDQTNKLVRIVYVRLDRTGTHI